MTEYEETGPKYRQLIITSLNESITLLSSHEKETMDYLCKKALEMMRQVKKSNDDED